MWMGFVRPLSPNGNGDRHCCQSPLRRAKDMPVFVTLIPPSRSSLVSVFDPCAPAQASLPNRDPNPQTCVQARVRCPSTALLGAITLAFCFVSTSPKKDQNRIALETNASSGASYQLATGSLPKELPNCLPAGDRFLYPLLLVGFPLAGDWGISPDHLMTMRGLADSRKRNLQPQACG